MATIRGGEKLQKKLAELTAKLGKGGTLRVGFLEGATDTDGTSVPMKAAINEFGAPSRGIPPRPFFRNMVAAKSDTWGEAVELNLVQTDYDVGKTLARVGEGIKGQLQQSIRDTNSPPLAASTIKRKGFDKPLIDTGNMINSVDFEIKS
jgi:hypothetical protein